MIHVALVGGGRWSRIVAGVLLDHALADRITMVAGHGFERCTSWAADRPVTVVRQIPAVLDAFDAGIVATRPAAHASAATPLVRAGLPVLVEKPFAASPEQESDLLELADRTGRVVAVDHEFLLADWATQLARLLRGTPSGIRVEWHEQRRVDYGSEVRTTDLSVSPVRDLMPHVLSILTVLLGTSEPGAVKVEPHGELDGFDTTFTYAGVLITCDVRRNSTGRHRRVYVDDIEVDWNSDNAFLVREGERTPLGHDGPGALARALTSFLREGPESPLAAGRNRHVLAGTWALEDAWDEAVARELATTADETRIAALTRTRVAAPLERVGLVRHTGDWDGVEAVARELASIAVQMADSPFTPLEELRARLGRDRASFASLLRVFLDAAPLAVPLLEGRSAKYWRNTLLPMEAAGVFDAVLDGRPRHPYRVGLYPGPNCMFHCTFCARIEGERYEHAEIAVGEDLLGQVIDEAPADDPATFYISGGLEPLTNPALGRLVARAAARGFAPTLYSNGFALTERTLAKQRGLWNLLAIRISLYGLDEDEYRMTTRRTGGFDRVRANMARFLEMRRERGSDVRVGTNYVVLPGRAYRLPLLIDHIARINDAAPDRPIDYLTLREDYSGRDGGRLPDEERDHIRAALGALEERAAQLTPTLDIDYGYALQGIRRGGSATLPYSSPELMRGRGYPQASVVVDLRGDVYLYREAAFPGLPHATRYVIGRVAPGRGLEKIVSDFLADPERRVSPVAGDEFFLDAFDQVVTARLRQLHADVGAGWSAHRGLLR